MVRSCCEFAFCHKHPESTNKAVLQFFLHPEAIVFPGAMALHNVDALSGDDTAGVAVAAKPVLPTAKPKAATKAKAQPKVTAAKAKPKVTAAKAKSTPEPKKKAKAKSKSKPNPDKPADAEPEALVHVESAEASASAEGRVSVCRRPAMKRPASSLAKTGRAYKYLYHRDGVWGIKKEGRQVCIVRRLNIAV